MPAVVDGSYRSSWIVELADGKLPIRPWLRKQFEAAFARRFENYENVEARLPGERCIAEAATPIDNFSPYGNFLQVVQTADVVALRQEYMDTVRLVRIGGKHMAAKAQGWQGSSIGSWDGDTLVVETVFGNDKLANRGGADRRPGCGRDRTLHARLADRNILPVHG